MEASPIKLEAIAAMATRLEAIAIREANKKDNEGIIFAMRLEAMIAETCPH